MARLREYLSKSSEETEAIGTKLAKQLLPGEIVALFGELGAGKTTFVRGIVQALHGKCEANSPTFVYLNIYNGPITIYHFDLYRLKNAESFLEMGFEEFFHKEGVCLIEWPERILPLLPKDVLRVHLKHIDQEERLISMGLE